MSDQQLQVMIAENERKAVQRRLYMKGLQSAQDEDILMKPTVKIGPPRLKKLQSTKQHMQ